MCGRMAQASSPSALAARFTAEIDDRVTPSLPDWNLAPTEDAWVVGQRAGRPRTISRVRWGLAPGSAAAPRRSPLINVRSETALARPTFTRLLRTRRCIVPADAFYEWKPEPGRRKQPYAYLAADGLPFALAGLWDVARDAVGTSTPTFAILTTPANALVAAVHDRMPVVLAEDAWQTWLDPDVDDPTLLAPLLAPAPEGALLARRVAPLVNLAKNNGPELLDPA